MVKQSEITVNETGRQFPVSMSSERDLIIDEFLANLSKKAATKRTYKNAVTQFFSFIESRGQRYDMLTRKDVIAFKDHLLSESSPHSALTVANYLTGLKKFYRWLESEKIYPNIAADIDIPRNKEYYIKQHLTREECLRLFELLGSEDGRKEHHRHFENLKQMRLRDYAMIYLMVWTGIRTIEVSRLDIGDITYREGIRIIWIWGKGRDRKDAFLKLPDEVYDKIQDYLQTRPLAKAQDPLFCGEGYDSEGKRLSPRRIQQICKECLRGIGLDDHSYSAHSLRHTTAVQILLNGGDMYDVFYALRHADPAVSLKYVKSIEQQQQLKKSSDRFLKKAFSSDNETDSCN